MFIPRDHYLTQLLILNCHQPVYHQGVEATLTDLRAWFWIPRGQQLVRRIPYRCTTCRRYEGCHYAVLLQAMNMSTDSFINCFRTFISQRGLVISDIAKQFKTVDNVLKYIFDQPILQQFLANHHILWHFKIEKAPWQGDFYMHMVKSVKSCLRKTLRNTKLSFDELMTTLTEIESTIISRLLTFVSSEELEEPLVPLHLICRKHCAAYWT